MKVLKKLATLGTIIVALIQVWSWLTLPSDSLSADVEFFDFKVPPTLFDQFDNHFKESMLSVFQEVKELSEELNKNRSKSLDNQNKEEKESEALNSSSFREREMDHILSFAFRNAPWEKFRETEYKLRTLEGIYRINLTNSGDTTLFNVRLAIPHSEFAQILESKNFLSIEPVINKEYIEFSDLTQGAVIKLLVWTSRAPYFSLGDIRLTHKDGIGEVKIWEKTGRFAQWLDKNWPAIFFMTPIIFFLALLLLAIFQDSSERKRKINKENSEPTSGEQSKKDTTIDVASP